MRRKDGDMSRAVSVIEMSRQEVAFMEKAREIKGLESLEGDFYTKFKPEN